MFNPCQITDVFRKRVSRGGVVLGVALKFFGATPPQSPALDGPSSLLGKAASAEGPDTAARRHENGEIPFLWSEHRPAIDKTSERQKELRTYYVRMIHDGSSNERAIWQVLRPEGPCR